MKPQKEWVHMSKLEPEKLEWMRDLPAPRRKGTKKVGRYFLTIPVDIFLQFNSDLALC